MGYKQIKHRKLWNTTKANLVLLHVELPEPGVDALDVVGHILHVVKVILEWRVFKAVHNNLWTQTMDLTLYKHMFFPPHPIVMLANKWPTCTSLTIRDKK